MSSRIIPLDPTHTEDSTRNLLGAMKAKLGMLPNAIRTMAHAPALLEGYLSLNSALAKGYLTAPVREQIALAVSQANRCEYCLSAHSLTGRKAGLTHEQIREARRGHSQDAKTQAILDLVRNIMEQHGNLSDNQFHAARRAGITDAEISEIVGHVALLTLTNYFNQVARTDIDFPKVLVDS